MNLFDRRHVLAALSGLPRASLMPSGEPVAQAVPTAPEAARIVGCDVQEIRVKDLPPFKGLLLFLPNGLVMASSNRVPGDSTLLTWVQTGGEQQITPTLYHAVFDSAGNRQSYLRITEDGHF